MDWMSWDWMDAVRYVIKAYRKTHDGATYTLDYALTHAEARQKKADFQRTRGVEFPRIWIEKL